nr:hypothetical protein [uncultured bacterium]
MFGLFFLTKAGCLKNIMSYSIGFDFIDIFAFHYISNKEN